MIKNACIRSFLKFFPSTPNVSAIFQNILIVSSTGLGDTLWGTPAIRAIKKQYPKSSLTCLTSSIGKELLRNNPHLDHVLSFQDPLFSKLIPLYRTLKKKYFDTAILFHTSQRALLPLVKALNPGTLIATEGLNKGLDALLTHPIPLTYEHEIQRRLHLLKPLQIAPDSLDMELHIDEPFPLPKPPFIALHPGAKDSFKRWQKEHFISLGQHLSKKAAILITGSKAEKALSDEVANSIEGAQSLAGKLTLAQMAHLLKAAKCFVTNDTGPMHMAAALNTPILALFGPTDPKRCGPLTSNSRVISVNKTCLPCLKKKCLSPFCLHQISASNLLNEIDSIL
ncbi:MAG: glycosyltransferase family 9 protein [Simkaniaceae bacterium]